MTPIDNYFKKGAYPRIARCERPLTLSGVVQCDSQNVDPCYDFNHTSPLNTNDTDPVNGPPDETVEFNPIVFMEDETIDAVSFSTDHFIWSEVLRRTVVHEIGHALLDASQNDHCANPSCIMYESTVDWRIHDFGVPGGLIKHNKIKSQIHNRIHAPPP